MFLISALGSGPILDNDWQRPVAVAKTFTDVRVFAEKINSRTTAMLGAHSLIAQEIDTTETFFLDKDGPFTLHQIATESNGSWKMSSRLKWPESA